MVLVTSNKQHRLICLTYLQKVTPGELAVNRVELQALMADLPPEFRLLVDLTHLELMEPECTAEIGRIMEMIDQHGIGLILRVVPDESKDIGFKILSIFHYAHQPRMITCCTLAEAIQKLALWD